MKYYIYLSETKVNMLYDQIGPEPPTLATGVDLRQVLRERFSESDLKNLAYDLGIDHEDLPGTSKSDLPRELLLYVRRRKRTNELIQHIRKERPDVELPDTPAAAQLPATPKIYAKLEAVIDYLERRDKIGDVKQPKAYFRGELVVQWGEFPQTGLVYFTGMDGRTLLGLGGSLKHIIDQEPVKGLKSSGSRFAGIQKSLIEELKLQPLIDTLEQQSESALNSVANVDNKRMLLALENAGGKLSSGTKERVEFVARRLGWWPGDRNSKPLGYLSRSGELAQSYFQAILGTPLYVALSEEPAG